MTISIKELRGMKDELAAHLAEMAIRDSAQLLEAATTPARRKDLAEAAGVDTRVILELANRADLSRIKGVAGVFSDLLEAAGVDTVKELATRRADNLHARIVEVNAAEQRAARLPTLEDVQGWIDQAKALDPKIQY
ncbi:MAG TPA: DUF4332 domain-containing protein [Chromatiales bacterium]|nr:DUF4332 domain-containing protein [Chromatiales bacterium]